MIFISKDSWSLVTALIFYGHRVEIFEGANPVNVIGPIGIIALSEGLARVYTHKPMTS